MINKPNRARLKMKAWIFSIMVCSIMTVSLTTDFIPGFFAKKVFAQPNYPTGNPANDATKNAVSQQIILNRQNSVTPPKPRPKPALTMPLKAVDRVGTAFSGRRSVSIKSTDAGIVPRYPQTSGCINCGTVDFVNVTGQGNNIDLITGGIISGVIRNKVIRQGQHHPYPPDANRDKNSYPDHQHEHQPANNTIHYDVGVTMDDGTQAIITQQNAPQFHSGDRIRLIDGAVLPTY